MNSKIGVCWNCGAKLQWNIFDSCDKCKQELNKQWFNKQRNNNLSVSQSKQNVALYYAMTSGVNTIDYL